MKKYLIVTFIVPTIAYGMSGYFKQEAQEAETRIYVTQLQKKAPGAYRTQPLVCSGHFYNDEHETRFKHSLDAARIFYATIKSRLSKSYFPQGTCQKDYIQHDTPLASSEELHVQWLGHATFLIQTRGFNILTDPVFGDLNKLLYPRKMPVGVNPTDLPHIDFVIISHNHRDHLDLASIRLLKKYQPYILVPQGIGAFFRAEGFLRVFEYNWWESMQFKRADKEITVTCVPARHWSGRAGFDAHSTLWAGWLVKTDTTTYFSGDTGYDKLMFTEIKQCAKDPITCAILPIGPCEPRHLMCHSHIDARQAVQAFDDLDAQTFIAGHWGTFGLGPDSFLAPLQQLQEVKSTHTKAENIHHLKHGERIKIS